MSANGGGAEGGRAYHHGNLQAALLDAGESVLRDRGLLGFTMRECARRAGVSHAAPKHHFGGVRGFLTAIAARGFESLVLALQASIKGAGTNPDARFAACALAYWRFARAQPEHFRVMFRRDLIDVENTVLWRAMGETYTELTNTVRALRGEPDITLESLDATVGIPDLVDDIVIGWCHIHGFAHLQLEDQLNMVPAGQQDDVLERAAHRLARMLRHA